MSVMGQVLAIARGRDTVLMTSGRKLKTVASDPISADGSESVKNVRPSDDSSVGTDTESSSARYKRKKMEKK